MAANITNIIPTAATAAPILFKTLNRAGFAKEIGQIQRATNVYAMSFNLLMIVLQTVHESQKRRKKSAFVNELRHIKEIVEDEKGHEKSNYFEIEKTFNSMAQKLERLYSCEADVVDDFLKPTDVGLRTCEKRCAGLPVKITHNMIRSLARFPKSFGNGNVFVVDKKKDRKQLEKFRCVENELKTGLVCECPRAPSFHLTPDMKVKLREFKKGRSSPKDFAFLLIIALVILAFSKSILLGLLLLFTSSVWGPYLTGTVPPKSNKLPAQYMNLFIFLFCIKFTSLLIHGSRDVPTSRYCVI